MNNSKWPGCAGHVLISHLDTRQYAALSAGVDAFIGNDEMPERVAECLQISAARVPIN